MNLCFIIGKIINEIDFKFIIGSKNYSIAIFKVRLRNNSIITVKAFNEVADKCYQQLMKNDTIAIQGNLNSKMEIIICDFDSF